MVQVSPPDDRNPNYEISEFYLLTHTYALSEASAVHGPWFFAKQIARHNGQTFYNPKHHVQFDKLDGRIIYFEGTYVNTFTNSHPTPLYDYNQQMYRLDLQRVKLPVAVYRDALTGLYCTKCADNDAKRLEFFAFGDNDSNDPAIVPVYQILRSNSHGHIPMVNLSTRPQKSSGGDAQGEPLFYAYHSEKANNAQRQSIMTELETIDRIKLLVFERHKFLDSVILR